MGRIRTRLAKAIEETMKEAGYTALVDPDGLLPATGFYRTNSSVDGKPWEGTMQVLVRDQWRPWNVDSWATMTELCRKGFTISVERWNVELMVRA